MIKTSIIHKLEAIAERHQELGVLLSTPDVIQQAEKFRAFSKEYAELEPVALCFSRYQNCLQDIDNATALTKDPDQEIRRLAQEELLSLQSTLAEIEQTLQIVLLPKDPNDQRNIFLEIRAAAGGDESAIFAGDLFRMYGRFAEDKGWHVEIMHQSEGEQGGFKEIVARISGRQVYAALKFESGAHRVQRVPETEAQGRIHTSTCTVAILPEVEAIEEIKVNPAELKIDTFRASGAGGQHVNKTDSAIRITHLPTGLVVECQDERSQHKNRAKAMALLSARLLAMEQNKQSEKQAQTRRNLVGTGDRSERIRTYNFPQGRVTDHRINLTLYKLPDIMAGDLAPIIQALNNEYHADQLSALSGDE